MMSAKRVIEEGKYLGYDPQKGDLYSVRLCGMEYAIYAVNTDKDLIIQLIKFKGVM